MPKVLSRQEKKEKENIIIENAIALFDEKSFFAFTMNELAKKCGMAKGTLFNYFSTKEALFARIMYREYYRWGMQEMNEIKAHEHFTKSAYKEFIMSQTKVVLKDYIRLVRLVSMKRSIINEKIVPEVLEREIRGLDHMIKKLSFLTEKRMSFLTKEQIYDLYMARHVVLVGVYSLASGPINLVKLKENNISDLAVIETEKDVLKMTKEYLDLYCR